jgi:ribosomal protein S18 acetylase RimI-like enzyme
MHRQGLNAAALGFYEPQGYDEQINAKEKYTSARNPLLACIM